MINLRPVNIYTDGSAHYTSEYGGWSFCVADENHELQFIGLGFINPDQGVSSQRAEMVAVIQALSWIPTIVGRKCVWCNTFNVGLKVVCCSGCGKSEKLKPNTQSGVWDFTIYSDSQYVVNGVNNYIYDWKMQDWCKKDGTPVQNIDLWGKIDQLSSVRTGDFKWVKGHSDCIGNELADLMANHARKMATSPGFTTPAELNKSKVPFKWYKDKINIYTFDT